MDLEEHTGVDPVIQRTCAECGATLTQAEIQDECNFNEYDELIVSTLPLHISKWLKVDLPRKAQAATGLPVKHVVGSSS